MKTYSGIKSQYAFIALALVALALGGSPLLMAGAHAAQAFNNVQIFADTEYSVPYSYTFTAYNLTGSLVGTYQSSFPAAGFELPAGDYLFTVSAVSQLSTPYPCSMCVYEGGASATPAENGTAIPPIAYYPPASEYGFVQAHVDGPQTLNVATKNVTEFPTSQLTLKVSFVNGTAASGVQVSASVVGQWSYWWGKDSNVSMWEQTDKQGIATLTLPVAPVVATAWDWVPVNLPVDNRSVIAAVGGEKVNVTVYWQPTYVGLSASTLLIPPFGTASLTLHYQQPSFWAVPAGVSNSGSSGATVADQPTGVPAEVQQAKSAQSGAGQLYTPTQIPPIQGLQSGQGGSQGASALPLWVLASVAIIAAVAVSAGALALRKKGSPSAHN